MSAGAITTGDRASAVNTASLAARLQNMRARSLSLSAPLSAEDQTVQAMDDASPTKWHLAHTTWFFETFVLKPFLPGYQVFDETFHYCFNSYYEAEGPRHPRPFRGLLTRPPLDAVLAYRSHVDSALEKLNAAGLLQDFGIAGMVELGINHEEQHQELLLTDILALFATNPLRPVYRKAPHVRSVSQAPAVEWIRFGGGIRNAGHDGEGFSFDNETPRHDVLIYPFALASRLVTNSEWMEFMADGGYRTPALWLSDGWSLVNREGWQAPLYFEEGSGGWKQMTLHGVVEPDPAAPVCHVSYYEADAFARWAGKRLPSEFEWEVAAVQAGATAEGNTLRSDNLRPVPAAKAAGLQQLLGDVWEWTSSAYLPYPGFKAATGAVGEYNGKFMVNQHVLRGASCATAPGHSRLTYRNFFYPHQRWQFMGLRLADNLS